MSAPLATPAAAPAAAPVAGAGRVHAFDALRAFSILGIVLWHAGLAYAEPRPGFWPLHDPTATPGFALGLWLGRGFRLATFFAMSGFFARLSLTRGSPLAFARGRLLRIGVPLVVALLLHNALLPFAPGPLARFVPPPGEWSLGRMRLLHLWFLEDLLVLSCAALVLSRLGPRLPGGRWLDAALSRLGPFLGRWWLPLACVPVTLPFLWAQGGQYPLVSMGGLQPAGLTLAWYGVFFAAGWLLHRHAGQLDRLCRWAWLWVLLGLAVRVGTLGPLLPDVGLQALLSGDVAVPVHEHFLARELVLPAHDRVLVQLGADAYAWLLFFGQMGLFLRWFRREIPVLRWFADASYWLFLSHLVPVALAQWWLAGLDPPFGALGRYLLVATGVLAACLLAYETLVRTTPVGTLLHGRRRRPPGGRAAYFRWRPAP